jgi:hypothetical protein
MCHPRPIVRLLVAPILLAACASTSPPPTSLASPTPTAASANLTLRAVRVGQFCGGMMLTADESRRIHGPRPAGGEHLTLHAGERAEGTLVATLTTADDGTAHVTVPAGTYCVQTGAHRALAPDAPSPQPREVLETDAACVTAWPAACDAVVRVPASAEVTVTLPQVPCFSPHPCVRYTGPPPP